jgi:glycosyltransferase XagB
LPVLSRAEVAEALTRLKPAEIDFALRNRIFPVEIGPGKLHFAAGEHAIAPAGQKVVASVPRRELLWALQNVFGKKLKAAAASGLLRSEPEMSAATTWSAMQLAFAALLAALAGALAWAAPWLFVDAVRLVFCCFFLAVVAIKGQALAGIVPRRARHRRLQDFALPVYTVIVPLFRETAVLDQLLRGLSRLDYPSQKLDIKLVLESSDAAMLSACAVLRLPRHMEIIVVPADGPQTKPKALNYALQFARGSLAAVFDAEDIPDERQLRMAAEAFAEAPPELICFQAGLRFFNAKQNWLTRQFAIEYACLFEFVLPSLADQGLPLPLGGTSNHFRVEALRNIGAWDPHNVTEDADIGLRMARLGYRAATIPSFTNEEATSSLGNWIRQRARWQKGYMQTWLVHMRKPRQLLRDLGFGGFIATQAIMLGTVVSALLHPVFLALLVREIANGDAFPPNAGFYTTLVNGTGLAILLLGYGTAMTLGVAACRRLGSRSLLLAVPTMPIYWILISAASWRALWDLFVRPHHWHKTEHGRTAAPRLRAGSDGALIGQEI